MIYLDNNATTRPAPEVVEAVAATLREDWGNPSSTYALGRAARARVEAARESVARLINAKPRDVAFTAGGTDAIHLAIRGITALAPPTKRTIIISAVEHDAVVELCEYLSRAPLGGGRSWEVRTAPVDEKGVVDLHVLQDLIDDTVALATVQWANHETGVVQPVDDIGRVCRAHGVVFHCDGIQWVGKEKTDVTGVTMDLLSMSAHKFHGPKGVGALWIRRGVRLQSMAHAVQNRETHPGTENTPAIVGMGVAADLARAWLDDPTARVRPEGLRNLTEREICKRIPGAFVNGAHTPRVWNTTSIALPGVDAKRFVAALSDQGIMTSTGAACSSGSEEASRVLLAMGVPEESARGTIRLSLSRETTDAEVSAATDAIATSSVT